MNPFSWIESAHNWVIIKVIMYSFMRHFSMGAHCLLHKKKTKVWEYKQRQTKITPLKIWALRNNTRTNTHTKKQCMFLYACTHMCTHICIHTHTHPHTHTSTHTHTHPHTHTHTHTNIFLLRVRLFCMALVEQLGYDRRCYVQLAAICIF